MKKKDRIICSIDVGTTKICAIIARAQNAGTLEVLSTGYANSSGLKKGIVVDLEEAAASIRKAADEAEIKADYSMDWVIVGASGDHFQSFDSHGSIEFEEGHHEVTVDDMEQVVRTAQPVDISPDCEIIHVLPQEFFLDKQGGILNPVGLYGSRLDVNVHIVTCRSSLNQNLINAVNRAQMRVKKVVMQQLASAEAVLTPDERDLGVALLDIGGGTTDIAVFARNMIQFTKVLPVGGYNFTRDLAIGLQIPLEEAERIKKEYGTVIAERVTGEETVEVSCMGGNSSQLVPKKEICFILQARAKELLELVKDEISKAGGPETLIAGVVLTGGGSLLDGMLELTRNELGVPARQGLPLGVHGLTTELSHPVYATALGLALFGADEAGFRKKKPVKASGIPWLFNRILSWVGN